MKMKDPRPKRVLCLPLRVAWLYFGASLFCLLCAPIVAAQLGVPTVLSSIDFVLTESQSAAGIDGRLKISLSVDETGLVKDAEILAGPIWPCGKTPKSELDSFKSAALRSARSFKFAPALDYDRKPIKSTIVLTVTVGEAYKRSVSLREAEADPSRIGANGYINAAVVNGRAIKLPRPSWPLAGTSMGGEVMVDVVVGEDGTVTSAGTLTGPREFHKTSREAACDAQFTPTFIDGKAVRVTGQITYSFVPAPRRVR